MRQFTATTHLIVTLAATAAAVLTAFALPAVALAADATTSVNYGWGKGVEGNGHVVTVQRAIGEFRTVRVEGPLEVVAHPGSAAALSITAEDNIEPLIETQVDGPVLIVRIARTASFRTHKPMKVDVAFTQLTGAEIRGSGDLRVDNPSGPKLDASVSGSGDLRVEHAALGTLEASISGSGDVFLSGTADDAKFSIAGSGDLHAADLLGHRVNIAISGSGDARVHATDTLDARVSGSGDIVYSGHPASVNRKIAGSGSISPEH